MADAGSSIKGVIGAMMEKSFGEAKTSTGVVGGIIEKITGSMEEYNSALEEHVRLKTKQVEVEEELSEVQRKIEEIEQKRKLHLFDTPAEAKAAERELDELRETEKRLGKETENTNEEMAHSRDRMEQLNSKSGSLGKGLAVLGAKVAGVAVAFGSWQSVVQQLGTNMKFAADSLLDAGVVAGSFTEGLARAKTATMEWDDALSSARAGLSLWGVNADEATQLMTKLRDGLRLTTEDAFDLARQTGQLTQDIGVMSQLLRVSTDELAQASETASKRFGKSTQAMSDELAGMYAGLRKMKLESQGMVLNFGDMTKAVLEAQANFQGYNFNLRQQAELMSKVAQAAQEQGASYEMSMAAAKGLTDIIAGGKAPDWAKYVAGDKLLGELKGISKAAKGDMKGFTAALEEQFGAKSVEQMTEAQIKGLKNLSQNYREYGGLSASYMAEELLRGTEAGSKEMFKLLKKYGSGKEGRELLKRVWNLDDQAATAATLALQGAKTYEEFSKIKEEAKGAAETRRAPTVADLKKEFQAASAIALTGEGPLAALRGYFGQNKFAQSIVGKTLIGLGGVGVSGGLQLAQGGGGLTQMIGATGALTKNFGALSGSLVGKAGVAGALLAAGAAGYAFGTYLRETFPQIDEFAQTTLDTTASLLGFKHGLTEAEAETDQLQKSLKGFIKGATVYESKTERKADAIIKVLEGTADKTSVEWSKAASYMQNAGEKEMSAWASVLAEHTDLTKESVYQKLEELKAAKETRDIKTITEEQAKITPEEQAKKKEEFLAKPLPSWTSKAEIPITEASEAATQFKNAILQKKSPSLIDSLGTLKEEVQSIAAQEFWSTTVPDLAGDAWDKVTEDFKKKIDRIAGPAMLAIPLGENGEGGEPGMIGGMGAQVGPDGSISIRIMIPRDALALSERQSRQAR